MRRIDLQLFGNAVPGKKVIYLYRPHDEAATMNGTQIAFVTENGRTKSKDADSTATKDGSIRTPGAMEQEITCTSILSSDDEMIDKLETCLDDDKLMDIWEADLTRPGTANNTFKGRYFQGFVTEFEKTSNAEDMVEISLTFGINGKGATGDVTVTAAQQEAASYVFVDTPKTGV